MISGLSVSTGALLSSTFFKSAGLVMSSSQLMAALHYTATGAQSGYLLFQLQLDSLRHIASVFSLPLASANHSLAKTRPTSDIDPFSSTDLEDAMSFAADIFEFLNQEYAMLACVLGEGQLPVYIAGGSLLLNRLYRTLSSRRFK